MLPRSKPPEHRPDGPGRVSTVITRSRPCSAAAVSAKSRNSAPRSNGNPRPNPAEFWPMLPCNRSLPGPFCRLIRVTPGISPRGANISSGTDRHLSPLWMVLPCQAMPTRKVAVSASRSRQFWTSLGIATKVGNGAGMCSSDMVPSRRGRLNKRSVHVESGQRLTLGHDLNWDEGKGQQFHQ